MKLPIATPLPKGMRGFSTGVNAFMTGLKLMLPGGGLFRYALAPILVSLVVLAGVAIGAFFLAKYLLVMWLDESWIGWLGGVLAVLIAIAISWFVFMPVMTIFAPWFIDPICERVHVRYTGRELVGARSAQSLLKRQLFALLQSLKWTAVLLFIELPLAVLALFTGVFAAVALPVSATIQGADLMDYPLALRDFTLKEKLRWCKLNVWPCVGLGTAASLMLFVPGLNLFVLPAGAAAATMLMIATDGGSGQSVEPV